MAFVRVSPGVYRDSVTGKIVTPKGGKAPGAVVTPTNTTSVKTKTPNLGVDTTGQINPTVATGTINDAQNADVTKTFNMQNPGAQTDASGATQTVQRDPVTGEVKINQTGGAGYGAATTAFTNALGGLGNDGRKSAQDAVYNYQTQYDAQDKAQEIEDKKQELINKGIPEQYSNDPLRPTLWQKSLSSIDRKYQGLKDQAMNQAITAGNQTYATNVGAVNTLGSTVTGQTPNFTPYQGGQSNQSGTLLDTLKTISAADLQKYGITQDVMTKLQAIAKSKSGGGGGGSGGGGIVFGGDAP